MAIVIEEGLCPNGMDFVSNEARFNPNSRVNGGPHQAVTVIPIGDDYVIAGITFEPRLAEDEEGEKYLCVVLYAVGGRESAIVGLGKPAKLSLGEVARVPLSALRERFAAALEPKPAVVEQ